VYLSIVTSVVLVGVIDLILAFVFVFVSVGLFQGAILISFLVLLFFLTLGIDWYLVIQLFFGSIGIFITSLIKIFFCLYVFSLLFSFSFDYLRVRVIYIFIVNVCLIDFVWFIYEFLVCITFVLLYIIF